MAKSVTGFTSNSSLILFLLLPCTFALFSFWNLKFLHWTRWDMPKTPGDKVWFEEGTVRWVGMQVHLWSVIPAGMILPLQFLPVMRRKYMYAHKLAGRLLFVLLMAGNITALMIANRSFGGTIDTQLFTVVLATATSVSVFKAWKSIRELRIDRHREWVLRTWAYAGSILTLRVVLIFLTLALTAVCPDRFRFILSCHELAFLYRNNTDSLPFLAARYPSCSNLASGVGSLEEFVAVPANRSKEFQENRTALSNLLFAISGLLGFIINVFALEVYLRVTREEDERLKRISGIRRRAAGLEGKMIVEMR